jgi:hypothetical protein
MSRQPASTGRETRWRKAFQVRGAAWITSAAFGSSPAVTKWVRTLLAASTWTLWCVIGAWMSDVGMRMTLVAIAVAVVR